MSSRDDKGRFKPKQPKARKKKTAEQKTAIAKRVRKEDARVDDVAKQQQRQQRLYADPRLFLTEGLGNMAQAEVLKQYNRVLAYNKQKEEQPQFDLPNAQADEGPTYSPGSPPPSPRASEPVGTSFPPGVLIKKKNPNKRERAHNKGVKRQEMMSKGYSPEFIHNVDMATYLAEHERKLEHTEVASAKIGGLPSWGPKQNYNNLATTARHASFTPDEPVEAIPFSGEPGDYMYELELARQNEIDGAVGAYSDILTEQKNTQQAGVVGVFREEGKIDVVKMTDEEKAEILRQRDELLGKKKMAKTQEEKDYYKRAIAELKAGDTQATRSKRREREERALQSAPTSFTPQVPGIKKYPGPANIVNEMIVVSTESGRRDLDEYEEQQYMGKGSAGQTERYTSGEREINDEYQRYASRKSQSLSGLRQMGGTIKGRLTTFDEIPDAPDTMTEAELRDRLDRIPVDEGFMYEDPMIEDE